ncbi:MAG: DUF1559 domain-containing protein [Pirellulales bacterium]
MPFQFTCPHCFTKTLVEDKYAGQTGACACCGKIVTLPELRSFSNSGSVSSRTMYVSPKLVSVTPSITAERLPDSNSPDDVVEAALAPENLSEAAGSAFGIPIANTTASSPQVVNTAVVSYGHDVQAFKRRRFWAVIGIFAGLFILGGIGWVTINFFRNTSVIQNLQERRNRMMSLNNLGKVARALNAYAATYGTYPPPVIYDENGKPKHSWRVLILPQLGETSLYNQYNFDEPWDSQTNSMIFSKCPYVLTCPATSPSAITGEANCFLIVGPGTVSPNQPGQAPMAPRDIGDGLSSTFLLIECANPIHQWTKPIDYDARGNGTIKFGGCYNEGTAAAKADGTAVWIPFNASPEKVRAFTTPNGNENGIDPDTFKP